MPLNVDGRYTAPFSDSVVKLLKIYQALEYMPPFVCEQEDLHMFSQDSNLLVPTEKGLVCGARECNFVRVWVDGYLTVEDNIAMLVAEKIYLMKKASITQEKEKSVR